MCRRCGISHWAHDFVSSPILTGPITGIIASLADRFVADEGCARGSRHEYDVAHQRVRFSDVRTEVPAGPWRGLGSAPNAFAIESMIDELAHSAGIDPLRFRLDNLPAASAPLRGVLEEVAAISRWGTDTAPGTGRGLACAVYKEETAVAVVAEVQVDHEAGAIRVKSIWCAQDCGLVVNPAQVEGMVMGNIIWGCSMALGEQITWTQGRTEQENFHQYPLLRNSEAPDIMVSLVRSRRAPKGVGESALAPVAPAIANALAAVAGVRAVSLPLRYEDLLAAGEGRPPG